jgi:hypothetical protein
MNSKLKLGGTLEIALYEKQCWLLAFRPYNQEFLILLTEDDEIEVLNKETLFNDTIIKKIFFPPIEDDYFEQTVAIHKHKDIPFLYCLDNSPPTITFSAFTHNEEGIYHMNQKHNFLNYNGETISAEDLSIKIGRNNSDALKKIINFKDKENEAL